MFLFMCDDAVLYVDMQYTHDIGTSSEGLLRSQPSHAGGLEQHQVVTILTH